MLPCAEFRQNNHHTASHAGATGVATSTELRLYHPPNQTPGCTSLKRLVYEPNGRYQKKNIATHPVDKTVEGICGHGSYLHQYFGQHPPPLLKSGASPPGMRKSTGPPPKPKGNSLLCGGLTSQLVRPDKTGRPLRGDRLTLVSQHPPPTKGQATVNRTRWKINWQHPPPTIWGVTRSLIATVINLRPISSRTRTVCLTMQGNITVFWIEAGTAFYYPKLLYPQRTYIKIKQLQSPLSFILGALSMAIKAVINRALYSRNKFAYVTGLDGDSMLRPLTNHSRQILPSYTEFNDHLCLVGNNYLAKESRTRMRYSH